MKHPVPKQKQSPSRTRKRYGAFQAKVRTQLANGVQLSTCRDCGAKHLSHNACPTCGKYNGRQILRMKSDKAPIKTIKA